MLSQLCIVRPSKIPVMNYVQSMYNYVLYSAEEVHILDVFNSMVRIKTLSFIAIYLTGLLNGRLLVLHGIKWIVLCCYA